MRISAAGKTILQKTKDAVQLLRARVAFCVFEEKPSDKHGISNENNEERIPADELFSRFTGDILKTPRQFVR